MWRKYAGRLVPLLLLSAILPLLFMPSTHAGSTPGQFLVPEGWLRDHPGPYTIRVALVMDQEWRDLFGVNSEDEGRAVLDDAEKLLAPAGIHLELASESTWTHDDSATSIRQLYSQLMTMPPEPADITVALAAGYEGPEGGFAGSDHRHTLIKHHPYRTDRDALILTHEVGHALGLDHHNCTHFLCIMSSHAYDERKHFCPEHLELLRHNAGFFEYLTQSTP